MVSDQRIRWRRITNDCIIRGCDGVSFKRMIITGCMSCCKKTGFIKRASASVIITQNALIDPSLPDQSEFIYQADLPVDESI